MDLSPKLLTEVEFPEQWRGYNQGQVDEFLERVAAAVGELQRQLADALERAAGAERKLLDRSDEDEIRRTLVLAQRTAKSTVEEARGEADRLVSETESRCRQLVEEAEAEAARLREQITERRRTELGTLAEQRAALEADIDQLRTFVDAERTRLVDELRGQLDTLERGFSVDDQPAVTDVDVAFDEPPEPPRPQPAAPPQPAEAVAPPASPAPHAPVRPLTPTPPEAPARPAGHSAVEELGRARQELADALRQAGVEPLPIDASSDDEDGDVQWRDDHGDHDPFLAELRRAVTDDEPLGPRDHDASSFQHDDDDAAESGGFFRRGRKRG